MLEMKPTRRKKISKFEILCIRTFYFADGYKIQQCSSNYFKSLGIEKGFEVFLRLAQEEPITLKVKAYDEDNFTIYFDENTDNRFEPIFIMKNGKQSF